MPSALSAREGNGQDVQARHAVKVPEIGCPDAPSGSYGSRRDKPVVRPDIVASSGQSGPDARVRASGQQAEGKRRKRAKHRLDERLTACPVLHSGTVHPMQQLRSGDRSDPDLLIRPQLVFQPPAHLGHRAPRWQAPDSALKVDEDRGV
jgi:hypothetical protein